MRRRTATLHLACARPASLSLQCSLASQNPTLFSFSTPTMPPQLPVEPVELIFDVLRAEHAVNAVLALRACAAVHSTWTRGAQSRLFRQLVIGVPAKEWNLAIQFFTVP
jgi:hypothetical protein